MRERIFLFNDALNTFYLRLYGVRHMVTDHSDSEKGNPLPPYRLLLSINSKGSLYPPSHRQDNTYHSLCYTSRGALAGMRNSSMGPPLWRIDPTTHRTMSERSTSELHPAPMVDAVSFSFVNLIHGYKERSTADCKLADQLPLQL